MINKSIIINLDKYGFDGKILFKETKNKNSYLKINRQNEIVFSKSIFMNQYQADELILKNISKFLDKQRINQENKPYNLEEGWIVLFGQYYNLFYGGLGRKSLIQGKDIIVFGKNFEQAFKIFCTKQEIKIIELAQNIAQNTTHNPTFKVKSLLAVWGNCNPKLNTISLNKRLIFFREEVITYVIYHELMHYTFQHHQKDFWNLVGKYCPNYKTLKKELKNW